jgi:hypothetical protein
MNAAITPKARLATSARGSMPVGKSSVASGHASIRAALAQSALRPPARATRWIVSAETTIVARKKSPGQGVRSAAGKTADTKSKTEKLSQAAESSSARSGPRARNRAARVAIMGRSHAW